MTRRVEGAARAVTVAFWFMTAVFAWLISVPFAYQNFIQPRLLPDIIRFAELQAWLTVALLPAAWLALRRALAHPRARGPARAMLGAWALAALVLPFVKSLAAMRPDGWALVACYVALAYPLGCAVVDMLSAGPLDEAPAVDRSAADLVAALGAALFVAVFYGSQALLAGHQSAGAVAATVLTHLVAGTVIGLVLVVIRAAAALREQPALAEFWLGTMLLGAALVAVVVRLVLPTLSITGGGRWWAGVAFAFVLTAVLAARGRLRGAPHGDGVLCAFSAFIPAGLTGTSPWIWALWLPAVVAVTSGVAAVGRIVDWNFLIATFGVLIAWLLALTSGVALATAATAAGARLAVRTPVALAGTVVLLGLYAATVPAPGHAAPATPLDAWAVADPSFRTLREALRPPAPADTGFYPFLQRHTNLGPEVAVRPFDIRHAVLAGAPSAVRPHVFLFVIDSLRRDYVSAYNPDVDFTPHLGRFAAENLVFQRALTRYGATGLSVPSIWVGGLVPHKQYPAPFGPFNALYALLMHEQYRAWLSWDNVVDAIVPREGTGPPLSANRAVKDFRYCEMVGDIRSRLDEVAPGGPPVFTWGLSQDVHISAITREGGGVVDERPYPGFHPPYASRIRRLDACFGAFVDDLKARGLYDHSVIIFTADHGDSLGEEGRWGHAYTLFPEILQVPLVVHLPRALGEAFDVDLTAPAYTADITPTLYALLGHEVRSPGPMFGTPLFWAKGGPRPIRPDGALVASSYGSVYGWLTDDARRLYVSDGVSLRDHQYDLDGTPTGRAQTVEPDERRAGQAAVRDALSAIASFYGIDTPP